MLQALSAPLVTCWNNMQVEGELNLADPIESDIDALCKELDGMYLVHTEARPGIFFFVAQELHGREFSLIHMNRFAW